MFDEIILPETKPETEWVRGRALRKVSPTRSHSRLQTVIAAALNDWAQGRGEVGTEWRFRIAPPDDVRRPLVPDVSFVKLERLRGHSFEELESPGFAPTVAVEILSPKDRKRDVASKIDVYLRGGVELVIVVDPVKRLIALHDDAPNPRVLGDGDVLRHGTLPEFEIDVGALFSRALDLPS